MLVFAGCFLLVMALYITAYDLLSSVWLVGIKGSILIPWTVIFLFCSSPSLLLFMLV